MKIFLALFMVSAPLSAQVVRRSVMEGLPAGNNTILVSTATRRVAIGKGTTPAYPLDVVGDIASSGFIRGNGSKLTGVITSTAALQTQVDAVAVSTGVNASAISALKISTGSIKAQVDDVAVSTGVLYASKVSTSGATMSGLLKVPEIVVSSPIVNIKYFGAVGDGVADDTLAIENAIASLGSGGGTVFFPPGTFRTSHEIHVTARDGIALVGAGRLATNVWAHDFNGQHFQFTDCSAITIKDMHLYGDGVNSAKSTGGIAFDRVNDDNTGYNNFENLLIEDITNSGLSMSVPILTTVKNVKVRYVSGYGFAFDGGTSVTVDASYAITGTKAGFLFEDSTYCDIRGSVAEVFGIGFQFVNSKAISMEGCGIEATLNRSVDFPGHGFQVNGREVTCVSCYATNYDGKPYDEVNGGKFDRINFKDFGAPSGSTQTLTTQIASLSMPYGSAAVFNSSAVVNGDFYSTGTITGIRFYGDGSQLSNLPATGADNLGNHVATHTLNMMDYGITRVSSITVNSANGSDYIYLKRNTGLWSGVTLEQDSITGNPEWSPYLNFKTPYKTWSVGTLFDNFRIVNQTDATEAMSISPAGAVTATAYYGNGSMLSGVIQSTATGSYALRVATATYLATAPGACSAGQFINSLTADGTKTCATPTGGGDAVLAATQTFTGENTFSDALITRPVFSIPMLDTNWIGDGAYNHTLLGSPNNVNVAAAANTYITQGAYYDSSWKRLNNNAPASALIIQYNGQLDFMQAASGTLATPPNMVSKLTMDTSGNLGVNTPSPTATLDVTGSAKVSANLAVAVASFSVVAGNVGIGTAAPDFPLAITSLVDNNDAIHIRFPSGSNSDEKGIGWQGNDGSYNINYAQILGGVQSWSLDDGYLRFRTSASGTLVERALINKTGFGLGTSAPAYKFHMSTGTLYIDGNTGNDINLGGKGWENQNARGVYATNLSGVTLSSGTVLMSSHTYTASVAFTAAAANSTEPIGTLYDDSCAANASCRVCTEGICYARLDAGTACTTANDSVLTGATAGRAACVSAPAAASTHWQELGQPASFTTSATGPVILIWAHRN